jgi:uncharacterized protein (TIGR00369 family)
MSEIHYRKLENMYHGAAINKHYEPTIRVGPSAAEVEMTVKPSFFHSAGALHGSVYFKMLDDACFFAVNSIVEDAFVVTVSFTTYLTKPVSEGRLVAAGKVVHAGKNLFLAEATLSRADGVVIGRGNGSFMKSAIPLTPELGYRE